MDKVCILGLAKSGIAALKKATALGYETFASELKSLEQLGIKSSDLEGYSYEVGGHTDKIFAYDTFIVSPGIPLNSDIIQELRKRGKELISEIEFGYRIMNKNAKIIAVTGSNGKSTTVTLIHHLLTSLGYKTALAGNIGTAFTSLDIEKDYYDYIVLELSSFQLDLVDSFKADVAVILNITPDHLNRYDSFDHYSQTKFNITKNQSSTDTTIILQNDVQIDKFVSTINGTIKYFSLFDSKDITLKDNKISFSQHNIDMQSFKLPGKHNILNLMASLLCISSININFSDYDIQNYLTNFKGLNHRLELVDTINNITFINDSKATNTDSVKYALDAFNKKVRIILGGSDKGEDFSILLPSLTSYAKKIYLIGATTEKMQLAFASLDNVQAFSSLFDAVENAYNDAVKDDIVLLSPACASYDMFNNFEHRGDCFKEIVARIKDGKA